MKSLHSDRHLVEVLCGEEGHKWLVVSLDAETHSKEVILEPFASPFSICAYCCSVSVKALDTYTIGRRSLLGCFWRSTAPNPYENALADRIVSRVGSYRANTSLELSASLICFIVSS